MKIKKRFIPFKLLPASIGLRGTTRLKAKVEYDLEKYPYELKKALARIDFKGNELKKVLLEIDLSFEEIEQEDFDREHKKVDCKTESQKKLVDLEVDFKYNKVEELEFKKQKATLLKKPWVECVGLDFDPKNPKGAGAFNLDWNDDFIKELKASGFKGEEDVDLIQQWFDTLCSHIALESGLLNQTENEEGDAIIKIQKSDDGKTQYS